MKTLQQLRPARVLECQEPAEPSPAEPAPRASAGAWCPASKRLAERYQREGNKVKLAHLMKILHQRGLKNAG